VPVLGEDDVGEALGQVVDDRDDGVAIGDGQGAAGAEVVLNVDCDEDVGVCGHGCWTGESEAAEGS
jgi:hypothetical protein